MILVAQQDYIHIHIMMEIKVHTAQMFEHEILNIRMPKHAFHKKHRTFASYIETF